MGCCHQRNDLKDSHPLPNKPQNTLPILPAQPTKSHLVSIQDFLKLHDWKSLSLFIKSKEPLPPSSFRSYSPVPTTVGCLSIIFLHLNLDFCNFGDLLIIRNILPVLLENLSSRDRSLQVHSFDLIEGAVSHLPESSLVFLITNGLFEKLLAIRERNAVMLAFKIGMNNEKIQRLFLKNHGLILICLSLTSFPEESDEILAGVLGLIMVNLVREEMEK